MATCWASGGSSAPLTFTTMDVSQENSTSQEGCDWPDSRRNNNTLSHISPMILRESTQLWRLWVSVIMVIIIHVSWLAFLLKPITKLHFCLKGYCVFLLCSKLINCIIKCNLGFIDFVKEMSSCHILVQVLWQYWFGRFVFPFGVGLLFSWWLYLMFQWNHGCWDDLVAFLKADTCQINRFEVNQALLI